MKYKFILIFLFSFITLYLFLNFAVYINSGVTCAKIIGQSESKGASILKYKFILNGDIVYGSENSSKFVDFSMDSLKKIDCIKVEYSKFWVLFNRIVDKKVLK